MEQNLLDSKHNSITTCTQGETNLARDWRVSSDPSGSDLRQFCFVLHQIQLKEKCGHKRRQTNWMGYGADLQSQLKPHPDFTLIRPGSDVAIYVMPSEIPMS